MIALPIRFTNAWRTRSALARTRGNVSATSSCSVCCVVVGANNVVNATNGLISTSSKIGSGYVLFDLTVNNVPGATNAFTNFMDMNGRRALESRAWENRAIVAPIVVRIWPERQRLC